MDKLIIKEIKELCNSFDKANTTFEKEQIVLAINYLKYVYNNDQDIDILFHDVHEHDNLFYYDHIKYVLDNKEKKNDFMKEYNSFFQENISEVDEQNRFSTHKLTSLNKDDSKKIIESFLKNISPSMYLFYQKMISEGRIVFSTLNETIFTSLDNSNTIIFVQELDNIRDILIFIHELSHAYYYYINNVKLHNRDELTNELKEEIPTKVMEMKFINYLQKKHLGNSGIANDLFDYLMFKADQKRYSFNGMKYLLGSKIAINLKDSDFNVEEFFQYVYDENVFDLIKENNLEEKKGKVLVK